MVGARREGVGGGSADRGPSASRAVALTMAFTFVCWCDRRFGDPPPSSTMSSAAKMRRLPCGGDAMTGAKRDDTRGLCRGSYAEPPGAKALWGGQGMVVSNAPVDIWTLESRRP